MEKSIIALFNEIRDIPYSIPLSTTEINNSCSGKAIVLKERLAKLGIESRYRVVSFKWSDLNLPKEVLEVPHQNDSTHVYLEVLLNGNWINVDPTWDKELNSVLPVNQWDGKSDTNIAVKVIDVFSLEESHNIMTQSRNDEINEEKETNRVLYKIKFLA